MLDGIPNEKQTKLAVEASGLQSVEDLKKAIDLIQDGTAKIDANTSSADAKVKELDNSIKKLGSEAVEVNLNASGSVEKIRSQLSKEIDLGLSSSKGTDILNQIKPVIEAIRDLVTKLEQKLPQSALGY
jgi:vacuolar-type H+-ATPase subunit I/STV1